MSYFIRESNQEDKNLIEKFNKELENHGFTFKLPIPDYKSIKTDEFIFENKFILTENEEKIRAGYTLKNQWFKINNEIRQIGYYYNPITAGLFNKKYNICGLMLLNDAEKKRSNLFCLGMGGYSEKLPQLLRKLNWKLETVPFYFKVCNPNAFLKNIEYLKNTKFKSFIIMIIKNSNLGWLFIKIFFLLLKISIFPFRRTHNIIDEKIEVFDKEADDLWENSKEHYSFIAVRNYEYLKKLYSNKKFIKLKFTKNNKVIGWSISLCNKLQNHKQFGNMNLGSIIDCLSLNGYETSVIKKTAETLEKKGAYLIISNQSHDYWKNALKMNSFINGPSNFIFASSKELSEKLINNLKSKCFMHITRGDGDGPINL